MEQTCVRYLGDVKRTCIPINPIKGLHVKPVFVTDVKLARWMQGSSVVTHTTKAISSVTQVLLCCHPKHAPAVLLHWVLYQYKIENRQSYNIKANSRIDDVNGSSDEERPLSTSIFPTDYVPLLSKLFSDKLHLPPPQVPDPRLEPSTPLNTSIIKEDLSPSK
ncbi:hypothetical protein J6590_089260, partial [Homalodisca vitripennis]